MKTKLAAVVALRKSDKGEEALHVLKDLLFLHPNDPDVNYQMAWTLSLANAGLGFLADRNND